MKEYDVKITEMFEKTVTVEAASLVEAEKQVKQAYYDSEYVLDSENFAGVTFDTEAEREIVQDQKNLMDVLLVKPGMYPQAVQIGGELEDLQKAVGGDIPGRITTSSPFRHLPGCTAGGPPCSP